MKKLSKPKKILLLLSSAIVIAGAITVILLVLRTPKPESSAATQSEAAIAAEDLDKAFEIAHALKGMYANLALTPLTIPVTEATELLRSRTHTDYSGCIAELKKQKAALNALVE